jgi:hypothetical protein
MCVCVHIESRCEREFDVGWRRRAESDARTMAPAIVLDGSKSNAAAGDLFM